MSNRKIQKITKGAGMHWVGDGFHVSSMFSYNQDHNISPFLLLDYAVPTHFDPTTIPREVGLHPHRGFETVTIVYEGEVEHRDTAGNTGKVTPGDVQWMTAASGVLHEEMHSASFTQKGGALEMVQLWVNLPAKDKMSAPHYQEILEKNIPVIKLNNDAGIVRVIAGEFAGVKGAAKTFTPVHLYDIRLKEAASLDIFIKPSFNALLLVLNGKISIDSEQINAAELVMFSTEGDVISLKAEKETKLLFMSGEPINEPVVGAGPFVMNTKQEIYQAYNDFSSGKLR